MEHRAIADQWVKGLTSGDLTSLAPLMSPETTVWHSNDGVRMDLSAAAARMAEAPDAPTPSFSDVRHQTSEYGFVVQATLEPWPATGGPAHIVQVIGVRDGHVTTIEEYIAPQDPVTSTP